MSHWLQHWAPTVAKMAIMEQFLPVTNFFTWAIISTTICLKTQITESWHWIMKNWANDYVTRKWNTFWPWRQFIKCSDKTTGRPTRLFVPKRPEKEPIFWLEIEVGPRHLVARRAEATLDEILRFTEDSKNFTNRKSREVLPQMMKIYSKAGIDVIYHIITVLKIREAREFEKWI